jgi:putative oxidoreductase
MTIVICFLSFQPYFYFLINLLKSKKMKNNQSLKTWLRIILGVFLIGYALNQFFHFLPTSYGDMPEDAKDFIDATVIYLPILYVFEIILGLLLIFNKWTAFVLLVLFPLSVTFLIFNISNQDLSDAWPALIVAILNFTLLLFEKEKYKPLFSK